MPIHENLLRACIKTLQEIFYRGAYTDQAIDRLFRQNRKWGSRDRRFVAETIYEVVRWQRYYLALADSEEMTDDSCRQMILIHHYLNGDTLLKEELSNQLNTEKLAQRQQKYQHKFAIRQSIPDWLAQLLRDELGDNAAQEITAMNQQADVVLRTNTLKTSTQQLQQDLSQLGHESNKIENTPEALALRRRANIFTTPLFKQGHFELQDANSQQVASFCQAAPGMHVIDACAGAGGKTLHLAALMHNKGSITALDIHENKLSELKRRCRRAGVHNVTPRLIDNNKVIKRLKGKADIVLIDAPCSGLGVLRRNPDSKWKLSQDFINQVKITQADILKRYSTMLKPKGHLIYATCSILPSENQLQVQQFLNQNPRFTLIEEQFLSPDKTGFDGFYMARLQAQ